MIKQIILTAVLFYTVTVSNAQQKALKIEMKRADNKSITFSYKKTDPGSYLVKLSFDKLENASPSKITKAIKGRSGVFTTLRPLDKEESIHFGSYNYRFRRGIGKVRAEHKFTYLLPFEVGAVALAKNLNNIGEKYFGKDMNGNWKAWQFSFKKEVKIHAIRKGVVVEIVDKYGEESRKGKTYSSKNNSILVEHKDGTFARYSTLKKGGMLVKVGAIVYPNTPIGTSGTYGGEGESEVRLLVYYLNNFDFKDTKDQKNKNYHDYMDPIFLNQDGVSQLTPKKEYTGVANPDMVQKEMTKREIKKLAK